MDILIVDDSKAMRMIVARAVRQCGAPIDNLAECENGAEALTYLRGNTPDVVLSDWNMPEMSGIELLKALRAEGNRVTFGFVTSESTDTMRATAHEEGADFLIAKPFTPESFATHLSALI